MRVSLRITARRQVDALVAPDLLPTRPDARHGDLQTLNGSLEVTAERLDHAWPITALRLAESLPLLVQDVCPHATPGLDDAVRAHEGGDGRAQILELPHSVER